MVKGKSSICSDNMLLYGLWGFSEESTKLRILTLKLFFKLGEPSKVITALQTACSTNKNVLNITPQDIIQLNDIFFAAGTVSNACDGPKSKFNLFARSKHIISVKEGSKLNTFTGFSRTVSKHVHKQQLLKYLRFFKYVAKNPEIYNRCSILIRRLKLEHSNLDLIQKDLIEQLKDVYKIKNMIGLPDYHILFNVIAPYGEDDNFSSKTTNVPELGTTPKPDKAQKPTEKPLAIVDVRSIDSNEFLDVPVKKRTILNKKSTLQDKTDDSIDVEIEDVSSTNVSDDEVINEKSTDDANSSLEDQRNYFNQVFHQIIRKKKRYFEACMEEMKEERKLRIKVVKKGLKVSNNKEHLLKQIKKINQYYKNEMKNLEKKHVESLKESIVNQVEMAKSIIKKEKEEEDNDCDKDEDEDSSDLDDYLTSSDDDNADLEILSSDDIDSATQTEVSLKTAVSSKKPIPEVSLEVIGKSSDVVMDELSHVPEVSLFPQNTNEEISPVKFFPGKKKKSTNSPDFKKLFTSSAISIKRLNQKDSPLPSLKRQKNSDSSKNDRIISPDLSKNPSIQTDARSKEKQKESFSSVIDISNKSGDIDMHKDPLPATQIIQTTFMNKNENNKNKPMAILNKEQVDLLLKQGRIKKIVIPPSISKESDTTISAPPVSDLNTDTIGNKSVFEEDKIIPVGSFYRKITKNASVHNKLSATENYKNTVSSNSVVGSLPKVAKKHTSKTSALPVPGTILSASQITFIDSSLPAVALKSTSKISAPVNKTSHQQTKSYPKNVIPNKPSLSPNEKCTKATEKEVATNKDVVVSFPFSSLPFARFQNPTDEFEAALSETKINKSK